MRRYRSRPSLVLAVAALGALGALSACDLGLTDPSPAAVTGTVTVDASASFAYLDISGDSLVTTTVATPTSSSDWVIGLFGTTVTANGGAAGPGGVEVACICANAAASNAEVMAMTESSELADFQAVSADAALSATFAADQLAPAMAGWYTGTGATATVTAGRSWIVREGSTTALLGKVRVLSIAGASAGAMGSVALEFAMQPSADASFNATDAIEVDVGTEPVYVDLTTGTVSTSANWDLRLDGWTIRLNSGVSGSGTFRAVLDESTAYEDITHTYAGLVPPQAFSSDAFTGVFATSPWYRYNLTGTDHQIWPTFQVYLLRRAEVLFKVQLISYYGAGGASRQITVRYQRLDD